MQTTVPVPITLRYLIESNNRLLEDYQKVLTANVVRANEEMMQLLGLNPAEGWRLDMETMTYIKVQDDTPVSE
jgi:hypothetical protein